MLHGVDTDFLVALEIISHVFHLQALRVRDGLIDEGHAFALAPQVVTEFIHIVTDPKRMPQPLSVSDAADAMMAWWNAKETVPVSPTVITSSRMFLQALKQHRLERKRLLDTHLAATLHHGGVQILITANGSDYESLHLLTILDYRET